MPRLVPVGGIAGGCCPKAWLRPRATRTPKARRPCTNCPRGKVTTGWRSLSQIASAFLVSAYLARSRTLPPVRRLQKYAQLASERSGTLGARMGMRNLKDFAPLTVIREFDRLADLKSLQMVSQGSTRARLCASLSLARPERPRRRQEAAAALRARGRHGGKDVPQGIQTRTSVFRRNRPNL
jgi:hypothetical protein